LDLKVKSNNVELNQMYVALCKKLSGDADKHSPMVARLKSNFIRSPDRLPSIQQAAADLFISERTLRRHLASEGVRYRDLVNEFRCNYAKEYLRTTMLTAKEIAFSLGYQDDKAFMKAFKLQTGMTAGQYREQQ
jgi:AraC-like DNA-binding protein